MAFSFRKLLHTKYDSVAVFIPSLFSVFFIGFFLTILEVLVHTIFISSYEAADLSKAYIISGLLGIVLFLSYTSLLRRIPPKLLVFIYYTVTGLLVFTIYVGIYIYPVIWASYIGIVCLFPLSILLILVFRRHFRTIFTIQQVSAKNLSVDIALAIGIISAGTLYVFDLVYVHELKQAFHWLLVSFSGFYMLQFLLNFLHRKHQNLNHKKETYVPVKSFMLFFKSKYTIYLLLFGGLSAAVAFIVHFEFVSELTYTFNYEVNFSRFYGFYLGLVVLCSILIDKLLIRKILYSYDSPYTLILIPAGIFVTTLAVLFFALTLQYAFIDIFSIFFILIGALKFIYVFSKSSIETPSLHTVYRTLDIRYRQIIYARMEGVITMSGMLGAGIALYIAHKLFDWKSEYNILTLISLSIAWFFVAFKLIKLFKNNITQAVHKRKLSTARIGIKSNIEERLRKVLALNDPIKVINGLKLSAIFQPLSYERELKRMIPHPSFEVKKYIIDQIAIDTLLPYLIDLKVLLRNSTTEIKEVINPVVIEFERKIAEIDQEVGLEKKLNSDKIGDKVMAIEFIWALNDERYFPALIALTKEFEPEVKAAAIKTLARIAHPSFSYLLIEYLSSEEFKAYAFEALVSIGEPATEYLEKLFVIPQTSDVVLNRIVRIYGKIASPKTIELLISKLENQSNSVVQQVILALKEAKFQATQKNINKILNVLIRTISALSHNLQIYAILKSKKQYTDLTRAFKDEIDENYHQLFNLLSLAYHYNTVSQIEKLVKSGNRADLSYAIELIEELVEDQIKPILFPLIEDISLKERIKKLQYYFPIEKSKVNEIIIEAITRDFNQLSIYPRAVSITLFSQFTTKSLAPELVFCLYHPNRLLQETAAYTIETIEPGYLSTLKTRIDKHIYESLQTSLTNILETNQPLLIEKFRLLKNTNIFRNLSEELLIELAQSLKTLNFKKGDVLRLSIRQRELNLFFLIFGKMRSENSIIQKQRLDVSNVYYSKVLISSDINYFEFMQDSRIGAIDQSTIDKLLFDNTDLIGSLLTCIETAVQE